MILAPGGTLFGRIGSAILTEGAGAGANAVLASWWRGLSVVVPTTTFPVDPPTLELLPVFPGLVCNLCPIKKKKKS